MFDIGSLMGGMGGGGGGGGGGGTSGVRTDKGWRPTTYGGPPAQASAMGVNPFTDATGTGQEQASGMNNDFFAKLLQALGGLGLLGGGQQSGGSPGGGFQMPSFGGGRQPVATVQYDQPIGPPAPSGGYEGDVPDAGALNADYGGYV